MAFKNTRKFLERDPFNPDNVLDCEISMDKGHKYGALIIHKINGEPAPQTIYGTPKLKYPFNQSGNWKFPSAYRIFSYRKYDGTNIFMYRYKYNGHIYTTFKVRLFPFLRGVILDKWKLCLVQYINIPTLFQEYPFLTGFAFEMYGKDHHHLIEYDHKLDIKFLFALEQTEDDIQIHPPSNFSIDPAAGLSYSSKIPSAELLNVYNCDYIFNYQLEQQEWEKNLVVTEKGFKGEEGSVWYLQDKDYKWHLFKCKPTSIEKIHWASYPLDVKIIRATANNVLEVFDKVDHKSLCALLLEEFPKQQIELSERRIQKVLDEFDQRFTFKRRVELAMKDLEHDLSVTDILRRISHRFEKQEMSGVYQAVKDLVGE